MFTDNKIRERFTKEEIAEVLNLMQLPENDLLGRFIDALIDDRREVIKQWIKLSEKPSNRRTR